MISSHFAPAFGRRLALASVALMCSFLCLTACSTSTAVKDQSTTSGSATRSASPSSQPSEASELAVTGHTSVEDADGYTFVIDYSYSPAYEKEVADEKPGFSRIVLNSSGTFTVTNTTPGRNLTFHGFGALNPDPAAMFLVALWPSTSAVCQLVPKGGVLDDAEEQRCGVELGGVNLDELTADGVDGGGFGSAQRLAGASRTFEVTAIPDASYDAVLRDLRTPQSYQVVYFGLDDERFTNVCANPDLSDWVASNPGSSVNNYNNKLFPLLSSTGTCGSFSTVH